MPITVGGIAVSQDFTLFDDTVTKKCGAPECNPAAKSYKLKYFSDSTVVSQDLAQI